MIIHLPTLSRWLRSIILIAVVAITVSKLLQWAAPVLLPADPYRIPAGDALSVQAPSHPLQASVTFAQFIDISTKDIVIRLKLFFLAGE